jgi:hypothetical protein
MKIEGSYLSKIKRTLNHYLYKYMNAHIYYCTYNGKIDASLQGSLELHYVIQSDQMKNMKINVLTTHVKDKCLLYIHDHCLLSSHLQGLQAQEIQHWYRKTVGFKY